MKSLNLISLITQSNNQFIKTNFYKLATQFNLLKEQVFEKVAFKYFMYKN